MPEVFISYGSDDRDRVLKLIEELQILGIDFWFDRYQIPGGVSWGGEIARGIKDCRLFMLIASNRALASENVRNELGLAAHYRKTLLPILIENNVVYPDEVQLTLQRFQYISAIDDFAAWKDRLLDAFRRASITIAAASAAADVGAARGAAAPTIDVGTKLLHLLANRRQQERRFLDELGTHVAQRPHRPILFVLSSEDGQGVDAFLTRVKMYTLPRYLANLRVASQAEWKSIQWPDPEKNARAEIEQRLSDYHADVRFDLDLTTADDSAAIVRRITDYRSPVVFSSVSNGERWRPALLQLLRQLILFWAALPDVPTTHPVIVLFAIKQRPRTGLSRWLALRAESIQSILASSLEPAADASLKIVLLPELGDVSMSDAEDWVRGILKSVDPDKIIRQLRDLFRQHRLKEDQAIPMERLIPVLEAVLIPANTLRGS